MPPTCLNTPQQGYHVRHISQQICVYGSAGNTVGSTPFLEVHLANNNISGSIPPWFMQFPFQILDMTNNQLSGSIPNACYRIQVLRLASNNLSGALPYQLGGWDLYEVDLGYNRSVIEA